MLLTQISRAALIVREEIVYAGASVCRVRVGASSLKDSETFVNFVRELGHER